jgi:hypothetical protein
MSKPTLGSTQPAVCYVSGLFPRGGLKRQEREFDHSRLAIRLRMSKDKHYSRYVRSGGTQKQLHLFLDGNTQGRRLLYKLNVENG